MRGGRRLPASRLTAASAERALDAAYPTLRQLLGEASFAALARSAWHRHPPAAGDLALWDGGLSVLITEAETLAGEPYLADVAALDWAVHRAAFAADATSACGLEQLAATDPQHLWLQLAAGTALIASTYPVACIWHAHRRTDTTRFDAVRTAMADGAGESALVHRHGLRVQVQAVGAATASFTAALLADRPLSAALQQAGDGFDFAAWLMAAVQQQQLQAVRTEAGAGRDRC